MKASKIAAFFDFDGTIYNGIIAVDFFKFLVANRIINIAETIVLSKLLYYYVLDKFGIAERYSINKRAYGKISGWNAYALESNSKKFLKLIIDKKLYAEAIKIIKWHRKNKHKVIIVTSALKQIVNPVRNWINIDDLIATEIEIRNGIYTGIIKALPVGKNRFDVIKRYCRLHNIDIKKSYAYSDHYSDIPLLQNIGNPAAVNPDRKLRNHAQKNKWKIISINH